MTAISGQGYRNCTKCTRWRPVTDFEHVVHRRGEYGEKLYIRKICWVCIRERKKATRGERDEFQKEYEREWKRNKYEYKPRDYTGLTNRVDQGRESKRKKRRQTGVPVRPIGKRNNGYYGGQKMR